MRCTLKDTTQRYKSLLGFSIYLTVRYKAAPFDMSFGRYWIYIISRLPIGKHIEFYKVKYIELRSNISRITILKNSMYSLSDSEKGSTKFVLPLILSYTVTSREIVVYLTLFFQVRLCVLLKF